MPNTAAVRDLVGSDVRKGDQGVLATELHRDELDDPGIGGLPHHLQPSRSATGERDASNLGVAHERRPCLWPWTRQHGDEPGRKGLSGDARELQWCKGCLVGSLQNHRVARGQRCGRVQ